MAIYNPSFLGKFESDLFEVRVSDMIENYYILFE